MLGFVAAALFAVAFVVNGTGLHTDRILSPYSLLLLGLACLALHLVGVATKWNARR